MELKISKNNVNYFFDRFLNYSKESDYSIIKNNSSYYVANFNNDYITIMYDKNEEVVKCLFSETLKNKCNDLAFFSFMCGVTENFMMASRFYRVKVKSNKTKIEKDFEGLKKIILTNIEPLKNHDDIRLSSVYTNEDDLTEQTGIVKPVPTQSYFFVDCNNYKGCDARFRVLFDYKTKIVEVTVSDFFKRKMFESACRENKFAVEFFDTIVQSVKEYFSCKEECDEERE